MQRSAFRYDLPDDLIAQQPPARRGDSRLLVLGAGAEPADHQFTDLPDFLRPGDLLVFNDTRVIPARWFGQKETGGKVEVLIERITGAQTALAHVRASKSPKPDSVLRMDGDLEVRVRGRDGELFELELVGDQSLSDVLNRYGHMPLPPYIQRADAEDDHERYQTVYADRPGAVAAPTAGLHFDDAMLNRLRKMGVASARVTLHVGAGTFQPVRVDDIRDHHMHAEWLEVTDAVCAAVAKTKAAGGRVIAIGTTAVRSLETAAADGELKPFAGDSRLFLYPGCDFRVIDAMLTNFHLPESTLLMLVCAFAGTDRMLAAYRHAVAQRYRFFSYGDAMFIERNDAV